MDRVALGLEMRKKKFRFTRFICRKGEITWNFWFLMEFLMDCLEVVSPPPFSITSDIITYQRINDPIRCHHTKIIILDCNSFGICCPVSRTTNQMRRSCRKLSVHNASIETNQSVQSVPIVGRHLRDTGEHLRKAFRMWSRVVRFR